jgi:hypothetical protein
LVNARIQVTTNVLPDDSVDQETVNTCYFQTAGSPGAGDWQALTDHLRDAFAGVTGTFTAWSGRKLQVVAYNMADAKPRPEMAHSVYTPTLYDTGPIGPRCLSCCLSYYSGRNLPRLRGRMYIGPWFQTHSLEKPDASVMGYCINLGHSLAGIPLLGTMSWAHCVHSEKDGSYNAVTDYWANDVWDIQRGRLAKETLRSKYHV